MMAPVDLDISAFGTVIAAPARARMLAALMDGGAHSAGELAEAAGVSPTTASEHLGVLREARMVGCVRSGRTHWYSLTDARTAEILERLGAGALPTTRSLRGSAERRRVRFARTCYDHLAGHLGVAIARHAVDHGWVDPAMARILPAGAKALDSHWGIDTDALMQGARGRCTFMRPCRDWTEHGDHLAGALGAALASAAVDRAWVRRPTRGRGLIVTDTGWDALRAIGIAVEDETSPETPLPVPPATF